MDALIQSLNSWGQSWLEFAWPMLWQSSLLIAVLGLLDLALRRRVRAVVRYAFSALVLVKLLLPPSLALPTGVAYWLPTERPKPVPAPTPERMFTVATGSPTVAPTASPMIPVPVARPQLDRSGWLLLCAVLGSVALTALMIRRTRKVLRLIGAAKAPPDFVEELLDQGRRELGVRQAVRVRITDEGFSPALCGLWRPTILLPARVLANLEPEQLRAVLLHELVHWKRGDAWMNTAQAVLQIVYWWHPLLWLANAHIRRLRELAVDDAVMRLLDDNAETYPAALLAVARECLLRPAATLGLIGIIESRSALKSRIGRLIQWHPQSNARLGVAGLCLLVAFGAVLLPMARGQARPTSDAGSTQGASKDGQGRTTEVSSALSVSQLKHEAQQLRVQEAGEHLQTLRAQMTIPPEIVTTMSTLEVDHLDRLFDTDELRKYKPFVQARRELEAEQERLVAIYREMVQAQFDTSITRRAPPVTASERAELRQQQISVVETKLDELHALVAEKRKQVEGLRVELGVPADYPAQPRNLDHQTVAKYFPYLQAKSELERLLQIVATLARKVEQEKIAAALVDSLSSPNSQSAAPRPAPAPTAPAPTKTNPTSSPSGTKPPSGSINPTDQRTGRQLLMQKLDEIRIPFIFFDKLPLSEVVKFLDEQVRKQDQRGINFMIKLPDNSPESARTISFDPVSGAARRSPPGELLGTELALIDIKPELTNLRLKDVLDAIVKAADDPIMYSVEDYAIVFREWQPAPVQLFTRTWKLPTDPIVQNLRDQAGLTGPPTGSNILAGLRRVLYATNAMFAPPGNLFYNNSGMLLARGTLRELEQLESVITLLSHRPPQVQIASWFIDVPASAVHDFTTQLTGTNLAFAANWSSLSTTPAKTLVSRLELIPGVTVIAAPRVTTLSGRQTQIATVDVFSAVVGINPLALTAPGLSSYNDTNQPLFLTTNVTTGPMLDLLPSISTNHSAIRITTIAAWTEFHGYAQPTNSVTVYINGTARSQPVPIPIIRTSAITNASELASGMTLILGQAIVEEVVTPKVVADLPTKGRLFRDQSPTVIKKHRLVLITPSLIDAAGNLIPIDSTNPPAK